MAHIEETIVEDRTCSSCSADNADVEIVRHETEDFIQEFWTCGVCQQVNDFVETKEDEVVASIDDHDRYLDAIEWSERE